MYWNQVQDRKVASSSKQATSGDSGVSLQNTVDDNEEHLMSLLSTSNAMSKQRTLQKLAFFDSTTFVTLSSSSSIQSTLDHVQYMKNKITSQDQHQLRCQNKVVRLFSLA